MKGVDASVDATCWFWACYRASSANGLIYSVPSQSCVVQSLKTSAFILITPSATSTDQVMPSSPMNQNVYTSGTSQMLIPSTSLLTQVSYTSGASQMLTPSTSLLTQVSYTSSASQMQKSLQIQLIPPNTQYSHWLPSPASLVATPYPSLTATNENPILLNTTSVQKTSCVSWWCSRAGYIAMSIAAPVVSILIIITVAAICSVMIRQRNLSKRRVYYAIKYLRLILHFIRRTNELHLIGYNINEVMYYEC